MSLLAHCPACSKSFRVPHADKTWRCKVCDGELDLSDETADEPEDRPCPACDEPNPPGSAFCGECGESLAEDGAAPPRDPGASREAKRRSVTLANHFAKRTKRLKWMLQGNMVLAIIYALVAVALYLGADRMLGEDGGAWVLLVVAGFFVVAAGMSFAAIRLVDRQPLMVVLSMAGLYTLLCLWILLSGEIPRIEALWTVLLWLLVPDAAAITRMAKENPDLYIARKLRGEHLQHRDRHGRKDGIAKRTRRDQKAERRRSLGKQLGYLAGVVVVLGLGWLGYSYTQRPPTPDETVATFHDAWTRRDTAAIGAMAKPGNTERYERSVNTAMRKYDWDDRLPPLEPGVFEDWERGDTHVNVTYGNDAGDLTVGFSLVGKRWYLTQLRFGEIKAWKP